MNKFQYFSEIFKDKDSLDPMLHYSFDNEDYDDENESGRKRDECFEVMCSSNLPKNQANKAIIKEFQLLSCPILILILNIEL
jgi:hypothetical protein